MRHCVEDDRAPRLRPDKGCPFDELRESNLIATSARQHSNNTLRSRRKSRTIEPNQVMINRGRLRSKVPVTE